MDDQATQVGNLPPAKQRRPFFSGYGEGYVNVPVMPYPPAVKAAYGATGRWMKIYFAFGFVLAWLLPQNILSSFALLRSYTDWIAALIPFIALMPSRAIYPEVFAFWYAVMWPLSLLLYVQFMTTFPFRYLPVFARHTGFFKWLLGFPVVLLITWMCYGITFTAAHVPAKSYTSGHGQLYFALMFDSRFGLGIIGSLHMLMTFFLTQSAIFVSLYPIALCFKAKGE